MCLFECVAECECLNSVCVYSWKSQVELTSWDNAGKQPNTAEHTNTHTPQEVRTSVAK